MGYTHYWERGEVGMDKLRALAPEMAIICAEASRRISLEVMFSALDVRVNGDGWIGEDHEDFCFPGGVGFNFCKTASKPYDLAVTACLALAAKRLGPAIRVSSDGSPAEWEAGCSLASEVLGETIGCPISD